MLFEIVHKSLYCFGHKHIDFNVDTYHSSLVMGVCLLFNCSNGIVIITSRPFPQIKKAFQSKANRQLFSRFRGRGSTICSRKLTSRQEQFTSAKREHYDQTNLVFRELNFSAGIPNLCSQHMV